MKLPSDVDLDVNRIQINVTGGSHHIHIYRAYNRLDEPDRTKICNLAVDFDEWALVVAIQLRRTDWELPPGIAFHLRAGEQLLVQTHFVNVGSLETEGEGKAIMNLHNADPGTVIANAGAIFGQDKTYSCRPSRIQRRPPCANLPHPITLRRNRPLPFPRTALQHVRLERRRARLEGLPAAGLQQSNSCIHSPPLALEAGHGLEWECYWENPNDIDYPFGPFTDANEHCNFFAFYYPTGTPNEWITCVTKGRISATTSHQGE